MKRTKSPRSMSPQPQTKTAFPPMPPPSVPKSAAEPHKKVEPLKEAPEQTSGAPTDSPQPILYGADLEMTWQTYDLLSNSPATKHLVENYLRSMSRNTYARTSARSDNIIRQEAQRESRLRVASKQNANDELKAKQKPHVPENTPSSPMFGHRLAPNVPDANDRQDLYREGDPPTIPINLNEGYGNLESKANQPSSTYSPASRPNPYQPPRQNYELAPRPNTGSVEYGQPGAYMRHPGPALHAEEKPIWPDRGEVRHTM